VAPAALRILAPLLAIVILIMLLACGMGESPALMSGTPVAGQTVEMLANAETGVPESLLIDLKDPAISAPLPDPRSGSTIRVHGRRGAGQCSVRIKLDPTGWEEQRNDDAQLGYRYRAPHPGTEGIRSVELSPGRIVIRGSGSELPCDLSAGTQREPLSIEFQTRDQRYCAEFGGTVVKNEVGRFVARTSRAPATCPPPRMNIVLIVADDLGYKGLGVQGSQAIPTPQIDRLAAEGLLFTSAYTTAAICAPARAALMSGRYQQRFGFEFNIGPKWGLLPTVTTIGDVLSDAGYATGIVGKWHLGSKDHYHPIERGFDEFFGFLSGAHPYFPDTVPNRPLWDTVQRGKERANETEYLTDAFAREAVDFIQRHRTTPFFLYVPFSAVHTPLEAPQAYLERFRHVADERLRSYYAMASAMDDAVGAIVRAIDDEGLTDDTLLVFTNDNGGLLDLGDNTPLRLGKLFLFEGGVRVPMIIRWPGVTTAGQQYRDAVSLLDLFPSFLTAANAVPPEGLELDGTDLSPFIRGNEAGATHEYMFWRTGPNRAVRRHDWKLVQACFPTHGICNTWLFDLATDIGEANDLSDDRPEIVTELLDALDEWESELASPTWPGTIVGSRDIDGKLYGIWI